MKTIMITGVAGFIGFEVALKFLQNGHLVHGVDCMTYASKMAKVENLLAAFPDHFKFEQIAIQDITRLEDYDYVINCAAETHVDNSIHSSEVFIESNVTGVHNLLSLISNKIPERRPVFLQFSTDEVYGDIVTGSHLETDYLNPSNPYSASKAAADMLINAWARTYNIDYLIVRPTNNYGFGQHHEKFIPQSVSRLKQGKKILLHDAGSPIRTWLHVRDTADAIYHLVQGGYKNEIYNISGPIEKKNYSVADLVIRKYIELEQPHHGELTGEEVAEFLDLEVKRQGQDVRYSVNDVKLQSTGWKPTRDFEKSIRECVVALTNNKGW